MRSLVLASALLAALPTLSGAAVPGMNLGWGSCALTASAGNFAFSCEDNTLTRNLIAFYRLPQNTADFVGVHVEIAYRIGHATTPPWFQFGVGGCREGSFIPIPVATIAGCTNPYAGANQSGGLVIDMVGPSEFRIRADWARDSPARQTAYTLYSALVIQLNTAKSADEGEGACAGCDVPACFVLNSLAVFTQSFPGVYAEITNGDVRNWAAYQGGAVGCGCPCDGVPTRNDTWGAVKALYR